MAPGRSRSLAAVAVAGLLLAVPAGAAAQSPEPPDQTTVPIGVGGPLNQLSAFLRPKPTARARALYRRLLPPAFQMPDEPMVRVHAWDFAGTPSQSTPGDPAPSGSYLENGISLRAVYAGKVGWYVISAPITSYVGWAGGLYGFGWPKYLATMSFDADGSGWKSKVTVEGKPMMTFDWSPADVKRDADLAAATKGEFPNYTSLSAPGGPGIWRLTQDLALPPGATEPRFGRAHITLDPDVDRGDAETPV